MAKPVLKFTAVAYDVNGHKGTKTWTFSGNAITAVSSTQIDLDYSQAVDENGETGFNVDSNCTLTFAYKGATKDVQYKLMR